MLVKRVKSQPRAVAERAFGRAEASAGTERALSHEPKRAPLFLD
jgi:hypothetical protein